MCVGCAEESGQSGIFFFSALYHAYMVCRQRKRNTINALRFEADLLDNLFELSAALTDCVYKPARSVCFVTDKPKLREIFAADFRDRVVHHLLVPELEKIYEPKFIYDSYACRRGKGTHAAVDRLGLFMARAGNFGREAAWFMQLDVRSFFMSIDKQILLSMLACHVQNPLIMALARNVVEHDCTENYLYKGQPGLRAKVPPHKSLYGVPSGKGLPIANLTSQFFANVYLNALDQFVKHSLKAKFYLRYVDDFIIVHRSRRQLLEFKGRIDAFLAAQLKLTLKHDWALQRVSAGADFLGYIVRPGYLLCRNRVVGNLKGKLNEFRQRMVATGAVGKDAYTILHLQEETVTALRQCLASYLGHLKYAASRKLVQALFANRPWLGSIFSIDLSEYRLIPLCEPPFIPSTLASQYRCFVKTYPGFCLFFRSADFLSSTVCRPENMAACWDCDRGGVFEAWGHGVDFRCG